MRLESSPGFQQSNAFARLLITVLAVLILTFAATVFMGCAGVASGAPIQPKRASIQIDVSPATASVTSGGKIQFSATLTATSNTAVAWHASAGKISADGLFTAPQVSTSTMVTVTVTSAADTALIAKSEVTVSPVINLALNKTLLPEGTVDTPYNADLAASGGVSPYDWHIENGSLPAGFALDRNSGVVSGTTSQAGDFSFTASVTDANTTRVSSNVSLKIATRINSNFDGPAELPRVYVRSDLAHTPAPGSVISVPKGGDLERALSRAKCGDTIELQAGSIYTGRFDLPAKNCDDNHWIIVRTSAPNSSLPPEGTRISPCYAGVRSLPARPPFHCDSASNVLAKVQLDGTGSGPIIFTKGANHYRFIGLEITRAPGTGVVYNLAIREKGGSANHIIFDRCWIHGTAHDETGRGVMLSGTQYMAAVDSYLSDFHCTSVTGSCIDAQAVAGGLGDVAMGPFKIVNNYLEAAAENIDLGGGAASQTPADIEIRRNYLFKPMIWKLGHPGYVGGHGGHPFIVKNFFELKNAQRVLFEANVLENTWGGFSQFGFGIVIGPKNQAIGSDNVCPLCKVTDITIRYVKISHVGGGLQLGNGVSSNGGVALEGGRYSIHDLTIDDIDDVKYDGYGQFAQVSTGAGAPILHDVTISHVTAFQPGTMLNIGDYPTRSGGRMRNFVYTNNIVNAGTAPTKSTGGGPVNCAYPAAPNLVLPACFQNYLFSHNAIVGTPSNFPPGKYPAGNFFPASASAIGFVDYSRGVSGDYRLHNNSRYKHAGMDGKDLGADIAALEAATAGVQ